jgi:hypothetical protein
MSSFEQDLRNRLREDKEKASPGFTQSVLARVDERPQTSWLTITPGLAAAAAVVLLLIGGFIGARFRTQPEETASSREQLLREYIAMQSELEEIRRMADDTGPVLYLGGDESVEVLYDLRDYVDSPNIRPASLSTDG